ncbi:ribbon-helix-helix protein, CopG family [Marinithermus hydrothermalis]|uniref:Uncharacterized protein n=1 Tax=Marinithermus hydrothermalis (strain DSM 14884 / JCM 11576 / T1) TaxID=869210 RepID=F2NK67_MARHT|nr:ribbon-helix-helix protein, CopG family [Marinithermus hydrothermalis]AEB12038.1 hypothetical protein Marky_1299 [Marinithermus hydrothermalis DSM 14884]
MGAVKQVALPEKVFALLERYRRKRRISRAAAIEELLKKELADEEFLRLLDEQAEQNRDLSEEEAMALANEAVAWARQKFRRSRKGR